MISVLRMAVITAAYLTNSFSQSLPPPGAQERLASAVQFATASVSSRPTLSAWSNAHRGERTDPAHFDTSKDSYEVDSSDQWCVTSVMQVPAGVTRAASFYVPEVKQGQLPPLPERQSLALTGLCLLGAVWFEAPGLELGSRASAAVLVKQLTAAWGAPVQPTRSQKSQNLHIRGSGLWTDVWSWRRGTVTVWVGWTDWDKGNGVGQRTLIWIVRDRPRDSNLSAAVFDTTASALKIAGLSPKLTSDIGPVVPCPKLGADMAVLRLSRWLTASKDLSEDRRAAALLAADAFVNCALASGAQPGALTAIGVRFGAANKPVYGCPSDGSEYARNLRQQAEAIDPDGPGGALAAVAGLQSPCTLTGRGSWPDNVLAKGRQILRRSAPGPWSPWVHFAMARAHDVKLSFSVPPGEADIEVIHSLTAAQARQERDSAIAEFGRFFHDVPGSPYTVFAWQEAWRLMAGLLPTPAGFGCGCE